MRRASEHHCVKTLMVPRSNAWTCTIAHVLSALRRDVCAAYGISLWLPGPCPPLPSGLPLMCYLASGTRVCAGQGWLACGCGALATASDMSRQYSGARPSQGSVTRRAVRVPGCEAADGRASGRIQCGVTRVRQFRSVVEEACDRRGRRKDTDAETEAEEGGAGGSTKRRAILWNPVGELPSRSGWDHVAHIPARNGRWQGHGGRLRGRQRRATEERGALRRLRTRRQCRP